MVLVALVPAMATIAIDRLVLCVKATDRPRLVRTPTVCRAPHDPPEEGNKMTVLPHSFLMELKKLKTTMFPKDLRMYIKKKCECDEFSIFLPAVQCKAY